eukprot:3610237-Amphidinium_carterae.1
MACAEWLLPRRTYRTDWSHGMFRYKEHGSICALLLLYGKSTLKADRATQLLCSTRLREASQQHVA